MLLNHNEIKKYTFIDDLLDKFVKMDRTYTKFSVETI